MSTMTTDLRTGCGLSVRLYGTSVVPLTPCCGEPAFLDSTCARCWRIVHEGHALAAILGHARVKTDLRQMIETLTTCEKPGACAADLLAKLEGRHDG